MALFQKELLLLHVCINDYLYLSSPTVPGFCNSSAGLGEVTTTTLLQERMLKRLWLDVSTAKIKTNAQRGDTAKAIYICTHTGLYTVPCVYILKLYCCLKGTDTA